MNLMDIARETCADDRAHVSALTSAADERFVAGLVAIERRHGIRLVAVDGECVGGDVA